MYLKDHLATSLKGSMEMVKMTLADMTDGELLTRPVAGANHGNWQIGHLIKSEAAIVAMVGGKVVELPEKFGDLYAQSKTNLDGAENFLTKDVLLATFEKVRAAAIEFAQTATPEQFATQSPEHIRRLAPTVLDLVQLLIGHTAMHIGQIQVLRRKLGKPILF